MTTELVRKPPREALRDLEQVVIQGNLATLSEPERIGYYARVCESLGLNPLTRPFEYITLNGKLTLYARKDATDQLRDLHGVSITEVYRERDEALGTYIVTAHASDRYGRIDAAIGVTSIAGLKGENLANAMMKAETKAKRRVTLSICGLGWMDEIEALDARSVEVAPRQAAASAISSRTAALLGGDGESEGEGAPVSATAGAVASEAETGLVLGAPSGAGSPRYEVHDPPCDHADSYGRNVTDSGISCGRCGEVLAERQPKPRARKAKPLKEGDTGYGSARAHALAAERGLDHEAVRRIAMDVLGAEDPATFSLSQLPEPMWGEVIAALAESPDVADGNYAERFAGQAALAAGLGTGDDPWPEAEPAAADMFGVKRADELTPAQWIEFGIRIAARNPLP